MGQKVNPHGLRVGVIKDWDSNWYAGTRNDEFATKLAQDYKLREYFQKKLKNSSVSDIKIERKAESVKVSIYTAKPGLVLGKKGANLEPLYAGAAKILGVKIKNVALRDNNNKDENGKGAIVRDEEGNIKVKTLYIDTKTGKTVSKPVEIKVVGIDKPDLDAQLVAENIAQQLEDRIGFRRAMKSCMSRTMKNGALGIKTACSGRLGGADMARTEFYSEGTIPLQTLRADIDYGFAEADTTYGKVGVKTWIYHGEVLPTKGNKEGSDK